MIAAVMRVAFAAACLLALFGFASVASAEKAAVLMPYTEQGADRDLADQTLELVAKWLKEREVEVVSPQQAAASLPPDLRGCRQDDCALNYLQYLKVDYAVLSTVWGHPKGKGATGVSISIMTRDGQKYEESWAITESIALSVDAALTHAYSSFLRGPGPWLTVRGEPQGAEVLVDGKKVGLVPYHGRIRGGQHQLEVRRDGFQPYQATVSIEDKVDTHEEVEVTLPAIGEAAAETAPPSELKEPLLAIAASPSAEPQPATQNPPPAAAIVPAAFSAENESRASDNFLDSRSRRSGAKTSPWNYVVGGVLAAASIPLLAFPLTMAGQSGDCVERAGQGCKQYEFGAQSAALLAGGVVVLAAGAIFLLATPIAE